MKLLYNSVHRYFRSQTRGNLISVSRRILGRLLNALAGIDYLLSDNNIFYRLQEVPQDVKKLFVFVSHDELLNSEIQLLMKMKELGFYSILFSNQTQDIDLPVDLFVKKMKYGRDFAVYRDVARSLDKNRSVQLEVLMLNSSMYWLPDDVQKTLGTLKKCDINVMVFPTESFNPTHHVQPYLFYIRLTNEKKELFSKSFEWVRNLVTKRAIVSYEEHQTLRNLRLLNWQIKVLAPYPDLFANREHWVKQFFPKNAEKLLNPTLHFWDQLGAFGIFGIKKSLFSYKFNVPLAPKNIDDALLEFKRNLPN